MNRPLNTISMTDADELQEAYDRLQEAWGDVYYLLRQHVEGNNWERLKAYGIGNVSAGLGEGAGDAIPCPEPICDVVARLVQSAVDEDETADDEADEGEEP